MHWSSTSYNDTLAIGARLAKHLRPGDIVLLSGDLGTGKTAFVKGLAQGLGINPHTVHSPTFTLMNVYEGRLSLYHFDLYRITGEDLPGMGYEEFFYGNGIAAVEWSERLGRLTPAAYWNVALRHRSEDRREITITVRGSAELRTRLGRLNI